VVDRVIEPILAVDGLTVFRGAAKAVDDVSLRVAPATWFGLLGANGSGKTSLLRALSGRLPCTMRSCMISGVETRSSREDRARRIGFMPPAEALPSELTCRQVLDLVRPGGDWLADLAEVGSIQSQPTICA
jgi:ABC-2 type transport system ATP-binding protein